MDQVKVVAANKNPLCANIAIARAFLLQSNMVSTLASAVTQRCLLLLPPLLKVQIGKHLVSLAETSVSALVFSCGIDVSRYGIKLAADVQLFEHQIVEDALAAALNLATSRLISDSSFSSRIPSSSAKIFVITRILFAYDYLDMNEFQGTQNALADIFSGLQIIKKFLFGAFSKVNKQSLVHARFPWHMTFSHSITGTSS